MGEDGDLVRESRFSEKGEEITQGSKSSHSCGRKVRKTL